MDPQHPHAVEHATGAHAMAPWTPGHGSPLWQSARGEFVFTHDGRRLIDTVMGHGACIWGHGTVYQRILERYGAEALAQGMGAGQSSELRELATNHLCDWAADQWHAGGETICAGLLHTGAEAVEAACKTAIAATGRDRGVAFAGAYHGSWGIAALCSDGADTTRGFEAFTRPDAVRHVPYGQVPDLDERDAFVIVEPVQGAAGAVAAPDGFLEGLRAACDATGTVLILDDVFVGMGRTGVGLEGAGVDPDIITLAKALCGGMIGSAVLCRKGIAARAWSGDSAPQLGTTYYGHPFTCAAVIEVLDLLEHHDPAELCGQVAAMAGDIAGRSGLTVRGRGAMQAVLGDRPGYGSELVERLLEHHIIAGPTGTDDEGILLTPSIVMSSQSLGRVADAIVELA